MIIDALEGKIDNRHDLTEIVVNNYAFRTYMQERHDVGSYTLSQASIGNPVTLSNSGTNAYQYTQIGELRFFFNGNRLSIWADGCDISYNFRALDFMFRKLNPTYSIITTGTSTILDPTNVKMLLNVPEDCTVHVNDIDTRMNGVRDVLVAALREMAFQNIPLYPSLEVMNTRQQLVWYCFPLARYFSEQVLFKDVAKQFIKRLEKYNESCDLSYLLADNIKEACHDLIGCNSKTVIKYLAEKVVQNNVKIAEENLISEGSPSIISDNSDIPSHFVGLTRQEIVENPIYIRFCDFERIKQLSNIFCLDHVHEIIESGSLSKIPDNINYPTFFNLFTKRKLVNLFKKGFQTHDITDTIRQSDEYHCGDAIPEEIMDKYPNGIQFPKRFKTFKELHDNVSRQYREIKAQADNIKIRYTKTEHKLDNVRFEDFHFLLPKASSDLVWWGQEMSNCIAGYGKRAAKKEIFLIAVNKDSKMTYNIEARLKWLNSEENDMVLVGVDFNQFYGYNNKRPDSEEEIKIKNFIQETLLDGEIIVSKEELESVKLVEQTCNSSTLSYISTDGTALTYDAADVAIGGLALSTDGAIHIDMDEVTPDEINIVRD